jgi:hypothetical protein
MALYAERSVLASDPVFLGRVRNAAMRFALYQSETNSSSSGALSLASAFLNAPDIWAHQFALAVSTEPETLSGDANDPAVDSDDGDTALQYAMETRVWPSFAAAIFENQ